MFQQYKNDPYGIHEQPDPSIYASAHTKLTLLFALYRVLMGKGKTLISLQIFAG